MLKSCGSATLFSASSQHFGDPTALRARFDNREQMSSHCWVLFSHAVDMQLVWSVVTGAGLALILTAFSLLSG